MNPVLSLIEPYWERSAALRFQLEHLRETHASAPLELVVVDDGSPTDPALPVILEYQDDFPWPIRCETLPVKTDGKDLCLPMNRAAQWATGEYLCLTSTDITFQRSYFRHAVEAIQGCGPQTIAWPITMDTEHGDVRCHQFRACPLPDALVMRRDWYLEMGGFDERFRDGYAFSDTEFAWRARKAGARFVCLTDQVVLHHHVFRGPPAHLSPGFARNAAIFRGMEPAHFLGFRYQNRVALCTGTVGGAIQPNDGMQDPESLPMVGLIDEKASSASVRPGV